MKDFLLAIFSIMVIVSCNRDDDIKLIETLPKITEYQPTTMFYPTPIWLDTNKIRLVYTDNRIAQRVGTMIAVQSGNKYYKHIGDTVRYYQDSIVITKQLLSKQDYDSIAEFKRKLITYDGSIVKEIYYLDYYGKNNNDTLLYSYNDKNQVDEITQIQSYSYRKKYKFKYDLNDNLNTVVSVRYKSGNPVSTDTVWFSDYDNSPNLIKNLNIFPECFYRSLSVNNFRKYIKKDYSLSDSLLISTEERNWNFDYDVNNYAIY